MATEKRMNTVGIEPFITKKELCAHLGFRDVKSISNLMRKKVIPYYEPSRKVIRFKLTECEAALAKYKVKEAKVERP